MTTHPNPWQAYLAWRRYGTRQPGDFPLGARLKFAAAAVSARVVLRAVMQTCRFEVEGDAEFHDGKLLGRRGMVFVMWHNRLSGVMAYESRFALRNPAYRLHSLISASDDGELLARAVRENGGLVIRGSSSRKGAEALLKAVRAAEAGDILCTVGDGPRGPRYVLKPGSLLVAKATGMPIVPVTWACSRALQLHRSWDQMLFPLPGSRVRLRYGEPLHVPEDAAGPAMDDLRATLQQRLDDLTAWADRETRVAMQIPKPKPGEILKRRKA
jgi:lysophospholipid acyltransferase (LPLAT)-like uncharacterized protein